MRNIIIFFALLIQLEAMSQSITIKVGEKTFIAELAKNSSTEALIKLLNKGPIDIDMQDYAGMEKVGPLPTPLPQNNMPLNTKPGDIILYQGKYFVIYYDNNSWSLTPIAKINDVSRTDLINALGKDNVKITISLKKD